MEEGRRAALLCCSRLTLTGAKPSPMGTHLSPMVTQLWFADHWGWWRASAWFYCDLATAEAQVKEDQTRTDAPAPGAGALIGQKD